MKNFFQIFATVVLIIAVCVSIIYLNDLVDGTAKNTVLRIIIIISLFALALVSYINRNKKLYYTDNEITVHCPNCGCECDESNRLIFHEEKKGDETLCEGVAMCNVCISNPKTINPDKVYFNLIKWNWDREAASLVEEAIEQLQNGNTEIIMQG